MYSLLACNHTIKKDAVKDLPVAKNDTFDFFDKEYDIPITEGFSIDTLKHFYKRNDYTYTLILPEIIGKEFAVINRILKKEIKSKVALGYVDSTNNAAVDTSKEVFGIVEDNVLLQMYKSKNLVSYGFLNIFSDPSAMRPFRKYFTINYDTAKKRFIYFGDYFKIGNSLDSGFLKSLIYGDMGMPDTKWLTLNNQVNFSSDKEHVYFYFDTFGVMGSPVVGLVKRLKKQYIIQFINDNYK